MILLDSSLIVACSNEADENHVKALRLMGTMDEGKYGTLSITDYVFDEVVTVMLLKTKDLARVADLGQNILDAIVLFRIDEDTFDLAWRIFRDQPNEELSFTDCTTIAVCRMNGISNIGTFDEDFLKIEDLNVIGPQTLERIRTGQ